MITPAVAGPGRRAEITNDWGRADYAARRAYAYTIGEEHALQRHISADAYLFLYKELVRLCKDRTYCWAGVAWLAQRLHTSQGTVKRWLTQLVSVGLIERKPRPGGDTALTIIPTLQVYDAQTCTDQPPPDPPARVRTRGTAESRVPQPHATAPSEASFFAPAERIIPESRDGSAVSRHTIKKPDPNPGLVGFGSTTSDRTLQALRQPSDTPVVRRLITAGVADPNVLQELEALPFPEIDAICRYVAAQPHSYNPPGLIVALARTGLGPALLGRRGSGAVRQRQSGRRAATRQTHAAASMAAADLPSAALDAKPQSEWSALWTAALQLLRERVPAAEFAAWFEATRLVAYRDGQAVIAVPNVFARETLINAYQALIGDVLQTLTDAAGAIEVVIG
jgi:hypothetical protein